MPTTATAAPTRLYSTLITDPSRDVPEQLNREEDQIVAAAIVPPVGFNRTPPVHVAAVLDWANEIRFGEAILQYVLAGQVVLHHDPETERTTFEFIENQTPQLNPGQE